MSFQLQPTDTGSIAILQGRTQDFILNNSGCPLPPEAVRGRGERPSAPAPVPALQIVFVYAILGRLKKKLFS